MIDNTECEKRILAAIRDGLHRFYKIHGRVEAGTVVPYRLTDRRLQALKRRAVIHHIKPEGKERGWYFKEPERDGD